jgi:hypothetical protein
MLAFYDDGDGCFELLEYKDSGIPPIEPWRPRLPKWAAHELTKSGTLLAREDKEQTRAVALIPHCGKQLLPSEERRVWP